MKSTGPAKKAKTATDKCQSSRARSSSVKRKATSSPPLAGESEMEFEEVPLVGAAPPEPQDLRCRKKNVGKSSVRTRAMRTATPLSPVQLSTPPPSFLRAMPSPTPLPLCSGPADAPPLPDPELAPTTSLRPRAHAAGGRATRTATRASSSQSLLLALLSRGGVSPHLFMRSLTLSLFGALCDIRSKLTLACLCKGAMHALEDKTLQAWLFSLHFMYPSYEGLGSFRGAHGSWCIEKADAFNTLRLLDKESAIGWARGPNPSAAMQVQLVAR